MPNMAQPIAVVVIISLLFCCKINFKKLLKKNFKKMKIKKSKNKRFLRIKKKEYNKPINKEIFLFVFILIKMFHVFINHRNIVTAHVFLFFGQ